MGEFGYELFKWQGYIRRIAKEEGFERVIIASRPGHELLYIDFCTGYIPFDSALNPCEGRFNTVNTNARLLMPQVFAGVPYMTALDPMYKVTDEPQTFVKYGMPIYANEKYAIIHARGIQVENPDSMVPTHAELKESRNWPLDRWSRVARGLAVMGVRTYSIGIPGSAYYVPGTINAMGTSMFELANLLAGARFIVGPSSGPLHLATLCMCPQVVWGAPHLEKRYKQEWNPFDVPVEFLAVDDAWDPEPEQVLTMCKTFLE
jgi:hypothetical protein